MKKLLSVVTLLGAGAVHAAGYQIETQDARASGMGGAVTANSSNSSSVYFNPAGLMHVEKADVELGVSLIVPRLQFENDATGVTTKQEFTVGPPPHLYAAYRAYERLAFGVGLFTGFGANSQWPDGWEGRYRTSYATLSTYFINPEVAFSLHKRLRLGAGIQIVRGTVKIGRDVQLGAGFPDGNVELGGAAWGVGANVGLQADLVENLLSFGVHYRSEVRLGFKGESDFQNIPVEFQDRLKDQNINADIVLPASVALGLSITPLKELLIEVGANYTGWSSFPELAINFEDPSLNNPLAKNWKNTWSYRVGAEYAVTPDLDVRAGVVFDPTPSPQATLTPDLPDADRVRLTVGVGYELPTLPLRGDLGYQLLLLTDTKSTAPGFSGTYGGIAHSLGITLGYRFN